MDTVDHKQLEYFRYAIDYMRDTGVTFESGLTDDEIQTVEQKCGFRFPPDLRTFLQIALPISIHRPNWADGFVHHFPNWRISIKEDIDLIEESRDWVVEGVLFDIERQCKPFWMDEWGIKSDSLEESLALARREISKAPLLIPVYIHRFMPAEPNLAGNPVFSIWQTDIVHYGYDLTSYLHEEFHIPTLPDWAAKEPRYIRFWSKLEQLNNTPNAI